MFIMGRQMPNRKTIAPGLAVNGPKFIETRFYKYAIMDTKMTVSLDGIVVLFCSIYTAIEQGQLSSPNQSAACPGLLIGFYKDRGALLQINGGGMGGGFKGF